MSKDIPLRATKCATCPFLPGSKYAHLAGDLAKSAMKEGSRICHSTGSNAINHRTGKPPHLCRGSRDVQNAMMCGAGVIDDVTDEAWNAKRVEMGMKPMEVKDP